MAVTVTITELREYITRCLDLCEAQLGSEVDLDADNYWLIETDEAFDLTRVPTPNAGQLSDDLSEMRTHEPSEHHVWHELGHLLGPLTRLAALTRP
jgi:hypothetical protein